MIPIVKEGSLEARLLPLLLLHAPGGKRRRRRRGQTKERKKEWMEMRVKRRRMMIMTWKGHLQFGRDRVLPFLLAQ
jgi:hypothetical protein